MLLNLPKLTDSPQYKDWSDSKGRLDCFQNIRKLFSTVYKTKEMRRTLPNRLPKLIKNAVEFQYLAAKETGSKPSFKFDLMTQTSEASLLKDLISTDAQKKFLKIHLQELEVSFHTKNLPQKSHFHQTSSTSQPQE
jgi:hypothetical protein